MSDIESTGGSPDATPAAPNEPVSFPQEQDDISMEGAIQFAVGDLDEAMAFALNFTDEAFLGESGLESFFFGDQAGDGG